MGGKACLTERQLAGTRVAYDLEVKAIKKKIEPELNDEFAKELGPYESLAEFTKQLREHLARDKQRRVQGETTNQLLDALVNVGVVTRSTAIDSTYIKAQRAAFGAKGGVRHRRSAALAAAGRRRSTRSPTSSAAPMR